VQRAGVLHQALLAGPENMASNQLSVPRGPRTRVMTR
jgi:hypothetical protein